MDVVVNLNDRQATLRPNNHNVIRDRYYPVPGAMILSCWCCWSLELLILSPYISSAYLFSTLKVNERTHQFTYNLHSGHLSHNTTYRNRPELHYCGRLQQLVNKPCIPVSNPSGPGGLWFNSEKADAKFIDDGVCYSRQYNNALVIWPVLRPSVIMPR